MSKPPGRASTTDVTQRNRRGMNRFLVAMAVLVADLAATSVCLPDSVTPGRDDFRAVGASGAPAVCDDPCLVFRAFVLLARRGGYCDR
jgi:hypothetical protein